MPKVTTRFKKFAENDVPSQCFDDVDRTCPTIIQIGANNGIEGEEYGFQEFLYELENFNLFLVEPIEKHFKNLPNVYEKFAGPTRKITYCNHAITETTGDFKITDEGGCSKIEGGWMPISGKSWNDFVQEHNITKIDLMLLDCEGYEFKIIEQIDFNLLSPKIIRYEYPHVPNRFGLEEFLRKTGYTISHCETDPRYNKIAIKI